MCALLNIPTEEYTVVVRGKQNVVRRSSGIVLIYYTPNAVKHAEIVKKSIIMSCDAFHLGCRKVEDTLRVMCKLPLCSFYPFVLLSVGRRVVHR